MEPLLSTTVIGHGQIAMLWQPKICMPGCRSQCQSRFIQIMSPALQRHKAGHIDCTHSISYCKQQLSQVNLSDY